MLNAMLGMAGGVLAGAYIGGAIAFRHYVAWTEAEDNAIIRAILTVFWISFAAVALARLAASEFANVHSLLNKDKVG